MKISHYFPFIYHWYIHIHVRSAKKKKRFFSRTNSRINWIQNYQCNQTNKKRIKKKKLEENHLIRWIYAVAMKLSNFSVFIAYHHELKCIQWQLVKHIHYRECECFFISLEINMKAKSFFFIFVLMLLLLMGIEIWTAWHHRNRNCFKPKCIVVASSNVFFLFFFSPLSCFLFCQQNNKFSFIFIESNKFAGATTEWRQLFVVIRKHILSTAMNKYPFLLCSVFLSRI